MHLSIYSLKRILYEGEAKLLNCKTASGEITVLDHHRPLISELKAGVVKVLDGSNAEHFFNLKSGFLEVNSQNQVRLLVDEA
jgi:ATP synthase F1 epsilon subunit